MENSKVSLKKMFYVYFKDWIVVSCGCNQYYKNMYCLFFHLLIRKVEKRIRLRNICNVLIFFIGETGKKYVLAIDFFLSGLFGFVVVLVVLATRILCQSQLDCQSFSLCVQTKKWK